MLKLISVKKKQAKLKDGQLMNYIPLPELPYKKLRKDFALAPHLGAIDEVDLKGAGGVLIKCHYPDDGLLAAAYLYKKYEEEAAHAQASPIETTDSFMEGYSGYGQYDSDDEEDNDDDDEEDEEDELSEAESILMSNNKLIHLPVIEGEELNRHFMNRQLFGFGFGPLNMRMWGDSKNKPPFWLRGSFPIIVHDHMGYNLNARPVLDYCTQSNRFIILIVGVVGEEGFGGGAPMLDHLEKNQLFESNMEYCAIGKPGLPYYEKALEAVAKSRGYRLARSINRTKLVKDLMEYRGTSFRSVVDIETFANKAIQKKRDETKIITQSEFDQLFLAKVLRERFEKSGKAMSAAAELDKLIGMDEVKSQLKRLVARLKFDKIRRSAGHPASDTHAAAVFMGSPGTAKTTVARILGKMLCEENVLENGHFLEVSRKDLVGKYVGWTGPTVAKMFEEAKGGTLFIDEAYSLMNEKGTDGYSEEALSEIVRQMENNPDTLVIFAGYQDKMRDFIRNANPGLRSRLTNVIVFPDYGLPDMCRLLTYFTDKEEYRLEDPAAANKAVERMVNELQAMKATNLGNGRLIRKLFKTAVGYMAEREDNDLRTLMTADIEKAVEEIIQTEKRISGETESSVRIGFH